MSSMGDLQAKLAALKARQAAEVKEAENGGGSIPGVQSSNSGPQEENKQDATAVVQPVPTSSDRATDKTPGSASDVIASQVLSTAQAAPTVAAGVQPVTLGNAEQIISRIAELRTSLANQLPGYERLLQVIHTAIAKDPDVAHVLSEEDVGTIVSGLSLKKSIVLVEASKKSSSSSKKLSKLTVDDL